jgi:hypothetical protein
MSLRRVVLGVTAALVGLSSLAGLAHAQRPTIPPPPAPRRPAASNPRSAGDTGRAPDDTVRARGDTLTARDTAGKANFAPPDSVMQRLLGLPGYDVTRVEGKTITFDAVTGAIGVTTRGMVLRDSNLVKSDTIKYGGTGSAVQVNSGSGQNVFVTPGQAPIFSRGAAEYDIERRSARVSNVTTSVAQNGQVLYITGERVKAVLPSAADSSSARSSTVPSSTAPTRNTSDAVFYLRDGTVTACDDSIPDYYFKAGEIKRTGSFVVARPAVLYIGDVPVMWLPFLFQDVRGGRHSGILAPNVGVSDIVRNSPSYRRSIEGLGYYWSISDYLDAQAYVDWRSSAGQTELGDDGFVRYNGQFRYKWIERYLDGGLAVSQTTQGQNKNLAVSMDHRQQFTRNSSLNATVNYVTDTRLQRQTTVNPYAVTSTIRSQANYQNKIGPASFSLGGSRTQYPGRTQVEQTFPSGNLSTTPLNLASWLSWTPNLSYTSSQSTGLDQASSVGRFLVPAKTAAGLDTLVSDSTRRRAAYSSSLSFDTPLQIFGYNLGNRFSINSTRNDFPELQNVTDVLTGVVRQQVFATTYSTSVDWSPQFTLPPLARNNFNLSAGVGLSNVDGSAFWLRNERTGGRWVHQSKRPTFSLSASPTLYGLFSPSIGPFTRLRHSLSPTIGYSYAPRAQVSNEFLAALGRTKYNSTTGDTTGYLGSLPLSTMSFGLSTNLEGKRTAPNDSNPEAGDKIKILTLDLGSVGYDFERARATHKAIRGLTTDAISPSFRSDLLPGFDLGMTYSLFEGSTLSDSARFKPYRTALHASFSFSNTANPFAVFYRLFGRAAPTEAPVPVGTEPPDERYARQVASQPVAGRSSQRAGFLPTVTQGWQASFNFSQSTPRPITGTNVIAFDPTIRCAYLNNPGTRIAYDQCVFNETANPNTTGAVTSGTIGAPVYSQPNTTSLNSQLSLNLTEHWAASVTNTYDFEQKQFATQIVSLQRDLHDWRAIFAFTQAPNGAFAFNFLISLKAEPELKFDYHKATYRGTSY